MTEAAQSTPSADVIPQHLIIRPRMGTVAVQMAVAVGMFACMGIVFRFLGRDYALITGCIGLALAAVWIVPQVVWFWRNAPRAIVATDEFLGITSHAGQPQRINWSSIFAATHCTKQMGMQWELDLIPEGHVVLRDIGINSGRWAILRAVVIEFASKNGASVAVDPLSEGIYKRGA